MSDGYLKCVVICGWRKIARAKGSGKKGKKTQADRWFSHANTICNREKLNVIAHFFLLKWVRGWMCTSLRVCVCVAICVLLMLRTRHREFKWKTTTLTQYSTSHYERVRKFNLNFHSQTDSAIKKQKKTKTRKKTNYNILIWRTFFKEAKKETIIDL